MKKVLILLLLFTLIFPLSALAKDSYGTRWDQYNGPSVNILGRNSNWYTWMIYDKDQLKRMVLKDNINTTAELNQVKDRLQKEIEQLKQSLVSREKYGGFKTKSGLRVFDCEVSFEMNQIRNALDVRSTILSSISENKIPTLQDIDKLYGTERTFKIFGESQGRSGNLLYTKDMPSATAIASTINSLNLPEDIFKGSILMLVPYKLTPTSWTLQSPGPDGQTRNIIVISALWDENSKPDDRKNEMWTENVWAVHELGHLLALLAMPSDPIDPLWLEYQDFYEKKGASITQLRQSFAEDFRRAYGVIGNNTYIKRCPKRDDAWMTNHFEENNVLDFVRSRVEFQKAINN